LGKHAVRADDAEYVALGAVPREPVRAPVAAAASEVDSTDDAAAGPRAGDRFTDELVPEHPAKPHIATRDLEVGIADSRDEGAHAHEVLPHPVRGNRSCVIALEAWTSSIHDESEHWRRVLAPAFLAGECMSPSSGIAGETAAWTAQTFSG